MDKDKKMFRKMKNVFKKHVSLQWANDTGFLSRFLTLSYIRATLSKLDRFQNLAEATLQLVTLQLPSYLILIWLQSLILFLTEEPQGRRKIGKSGGHVVIAGAK